MTDRQQTMPARDVAYSPSSREANVITSVDMAWLAEAVEARGGTRPYLAVHALRSSELRSIFTSLVGLGARNYWIEPGNGHDTPVYDLPYAWQLADLAVDRAQSPVQCPDGVAPGMPLRGNDLRCAFWNAEQAEEALLAVEYASLSGDGMRYRQIGSRVYPGGDTYPWLRIQAYDDAAGGVYGWEVEGGTISADLSSLPSAPQNVADWECETAYCIIDFRTDHPVSADRYGATAAVPIDCTLLGGTLSIDALDALDALRTAVGHYGLDMDTETLLSGYVLGLVPVLKVPQNYRLSDIGWSFTP